MSDTKARYVVINVGDLLLHQPAVPGMVAVPRELIAHILKTWYPESFQAEYGDEDATAKELRQILKEQGDG